MKSDIDDIMKEFIDVLKEEMENTENKVYIEKYNKTINKITEIIENDLFDQEKYELLRRYVADCLPWSEKLLEAWQKVNRIGKLLSPRGKNKDSKEKPGIQ